MTMTAIIPSTQAKSMRKKYPKKKIQWDYGMTEEEKEESGKLEAIRKAVKKSQKQFENGEYTVVDENFGKNLLKEIHSEFLSPKK